LSIGEWYKNGTDTNRMWLHKLLSSGSE
jgi:hypothetical protein